MKTEILKLLRSSDGYVSGQQLCERFGVSRTAVWKVINQLKEEGYRVEAIRNKGYRILDDTDVMTKEELESRITDITEWAGRELYVYDTTDSTNIQAKRLGENGAAHGAALPQISRAREEADGDAVGSHRKGAVFPCRCFCGRNLHRIRHLC